MIEREKEGGGIGVCDSRVCTELFYRENPLKIVRSQGCYMYDELGNKYLDCVNNVAQGMWRDQ